MPIINPFSDENSSPDDTSLSDKEPTESQNTNPLIPQFTFSTDSESDAFPTDALTGALRDMAEQSSSVFRVSPELAGTLALGALSVALGKGLRLRTRRYDTPANLYAICGAYSTGGKGTCYKQILEPLRQWEEDSLKQWNSNEGPRIRASRLRLEERKRILAKDLAKQSEPDFQSEYELQSIERQLSELEAITVPAVFAEDITSQETVIRAKQQAGSIGLCSSEGGAILATLRGQWNALQREDDSIWLKGYSVESYQRNRVGMPPLVVHELCLNVILCTQPDEVEDLFSNPRFLKGGALGRCLILKDESAPQEDDGMNPRLPAETVQKWRSLLVELLEAFRFREEFAIVQASHEADEIIRGFRNEKIRNWKSRRAVVSFDGRHAENALRIATCLHAARWGINAPEHELDAETAQNAVRLMRWYAMTQDEQTTEIRDNGTSKRWKRIAKAIEKCSRDFPDIGLRGAYVSDIRRNHFRGEDPTQFPQEFPDRLKLVFHRTQPTGPKPGILIITDPNKK